MAGDVIECLHEFCHEPSMAGSRHGFRFCEYHMHCAAHVIPIEALPPGFMPSQIVGSNSPPRTLYAVKLDVLKAHMSHHPMWSNQYFVQVHDLPGYTVSRMRKRLEKSGVIPRSRIAERTRFTNTHKEKDKAA